MAKDVMGFAASQLLWAGGRSVLDELLQETERLMARFPCLLTLIEADRDRYALEQKALRERDRLWALAQSPLLPMAQPESKEAPPLALATGRPRTPAQVVLIFMVLRGFVGGRLADAQLYGLLCDSITLRSYLPDPDSVPAISTIVSILNHELSQATREAVNQAILQMAQAEGLDDFATLVADSTASAANSRYPTDNGLILRLLERATGLWQALGPQGVPAYQDWRIPRWLKMLRRHGFAIDQAKTRPKRRAAYRRFLAVSENILNHLGRQYDLHDEPVQGRLRTLPPSQADSLGAAWHAILQDLADADELRQIAYLRVIDGQEPDPERIWSLSDPDARLIKKGGRDTVFGYRPTLVRSESGLLTALCLDRGNTADSTLVLQAIDAHQAATGISPSAASFDDGYANKEDARLAEKHGTIVSVSGAKGKRQTDLSDWDSETYSRLRRLRPQIESDINALKQRHGWARLSRRGLAAVRAGLLEGMIAYNLLKLRRLRQAAQAAANAA